MSVVELADMTDVSLRARWQRWRHIVLALVAVLLVVGAFLVWGPIGFAGVTSYPTPRELSTNVEGSGTSCPIGPAGVDGRSFILLGCGNRYGGPLGIRYYTATDPYGLAVCASNASGQLAAAENAAETAD